jgi:shikimate kinase / 3-dehydroquinate synthase
VTRYIFNHPVSPQGITKTPQCGSIIITGFMGTGKSDAGTILAQMLGRPFLDTDAMIVERSDMSIPEIWEHHGENYFRELEQQVCRELASRDGLVIATGGGAMVDDTNYQALKKGNTLLLLTATPEAIARRIGNDTSRPLLAGNSDRITQLLAERAPAYNRIPNQVDTTHLTSHEAAAQIAAILPQQFQQIETTPETQPQQSSIRIGRGLISDLGTQLRSLGTSGRIQLMMAAPIIDLYLPQIAAALERAELTWNLIPIRDGDKEKNLNQVQEVLMALSANGAARDSVAVTIGGGVTGDLGGLAASIYMRGMGFVQVPTTLLAQVDASIGGKVGVNLPAAKNLVGNFYQPTLILSDPCTLRTLPPQELANGMAEVIKTAILGSQDLFDLLCSRLSKPQEQSRFDIDFLEQCVSACVSIKATIVEQDPKERGQRRVLNLGHTAGHALEAIAGYQGLSHGEAVAIGFVIAATISLRRRLVDESFVKTVLELNRCYGLPSCPPEFNTDEFLTSLHLDKKKKAGRLRFVLPCGIGICDLVDDVTDDEVLSAMKEIAQ